MSPSPRVSVIMPFFDVDASFFCEAIESVLAQSWSDWELFLVDDGSANGSSEIAQGYAGRHPDRIRYLQHEDHRNLGMSASRNLALRHATGEYIAFLDADDIWLPDKLERQIPILVSKSEAALTYWNALVWYGWTGAPADRQLDNVRELGVVLDRLYFPPDMIVRYLLGKAAVPYMCSLLARHTAIEQVGGFEESFPGLYEDQVFYAKMMLAHPVFVSAGWKEKYRRHPDSSYSVAKRMGQVDAQYRRYQCWLAEYLAEHGMQGTRVWRIVQRELWLSRHPRVERLVDGGRRVIKKIRKSPGRIAKKVLPRRTFG